MPTSIATENIPSGGWIVNGDQVDTPSTSVAVTHLQWILYVDETTGLPALNGLLVAAEAVNDQPGLIAVMDAVIILLNNNQD